MFIDTHAHLNLMTEKPENQPINPENLTLIQKIVDQASTASVKLIINISTEPIDSIDSVKIARSCPHVFATVGLHPCNSLSNWKEQIKEIEKLIKDKEQNKIVGIGEIGLDFYHEPFDSNAQNAAFRTQIEMALANNLPIVVHVRKAADEVLRVLEEYKNNGLRGVIHCFSQNQQFADQVLEWGFYIGIDGHITYPKNNELRQTIKKTPLDRLLLETDAPFLPPQQFRGKQNHPAYIPLIAEFIASLKETSLENIENQTTENAKKLFGLTL